MSKQFYFRPRSILSIYRARFSFCLFSFFLSSARRRDIVIDASSLEQAPYVLPVPELSLVS